MKITDEFKRELQARRKELAIKHEAYSEQGNALRARHIEIMKDMEKIRNALEGIDAIEALEDGPQ